MDYIGCENTLIEFNKAVHKISDDLQFMKAEYLSARTDEVRQQIIDGINNGTIKTKDDILDITVTMSPGYTYLKEQGLI